MADTTTDGTSGATGAKPGGTAEPFRVFQTQAEFDKVAATIRYEAERKARTVTADERARMEAIEGELEAAKLRDLEREKNYQEAAALREKSAADKIAKAEEGRAKLRSAIQRNVEAQIKALAAANGAYDPEDVLVRIMPRILIDEDGAIRVSDAPGEAAHDGLTMDQAIADLLKAKPHLAKAAGAGTSAHSTGGASVGAPVSGSPSQRDAQARVDEAKARVRANPGDGQASSDLLRAEAALKALAK